MLIDWMTLRLSHEHLSLDVLEKLRSYSQTIVKVQGGLGHKLHTLSTTTPGEQVVGLVSLISAIEWESCAWLGVRSDSHAVQVRMSAVDVVIAGSPARVDQLHNVFGDSCPKRCATKMIEFASRHLNVSLPNDLQKWGLTRLDITKNLFCGDENTAKAALHSLDISSGWKKCYRQGPYSLKWQPASDLQRGKAYLKGLHMRKQVRARRAVLNEEELVACDGLLRLELTLGGRFFRRVYLNHWTDLEITDIDRFHEQYFGTLMGDAIVKDNTELRNLLTHVCDSKRQANNVFRFWCSVTTVGYESASRTVSRATLFRYTKVLKEAGISQADLKSGVIIPFRSQRIKTLPAVSSFSEIYRMIA